MNTQKDLYDLLSRDNSLDKIQKYLNDVLEIRGFNNETADKKILMLVEEVGELAKALRKEKVGMKIDKNKINNYDSVESEIADVFIVLVSLCNILNINLYDAFLEKEKNNINRNWES